MTMTTPTTAVVHDHFVLLLDAKQFENLPAWLTDNFTIIEGGTHAGGSSRNKLIVFKDGTYLELFNWIQRPVEFLAWANKQPGLIDFAITTMPPVTAEQNYSTVLNNLQRIPSDSNLGVSYVKPIAGGRNRGDGTEVKWKNSRPSFAKNDTAPDASYFPNGRVDVPFFCHDVTDRTVRVPFDKSDITIHPCGATGIESVDIVVPNSHLLQYSLLYGAVLDVTASISSIQKQQKQMRFPIGVPTSIDSPEAYVTVSRAVDDDPFFSERGIGIRSLTLRTASSVIDKHEIKPLADAGIGNTVRIRTENIA